MGKRTQDQALYDGEGCDIKPFRPTDGKKIKEPSRVVFLSSPIICIMQRNRRGLKNFLTENFRHKGLVPRPERKSAYIPAMAAIPLDDQFRGWGKLQIREILIGNDRVVPGHENR